MGIVRLTLVSLTLLAAGAGGASGARLFDNGHSGAVVKTATEKGKTEGKPKPKPKPKGKAAAKTEYKRAAPNDIERLPPLPNWPPPENDSSTYP